MEDHEILELYFAREEAAIAATQERYGTRLEQLSRRILWDPEDARECVNDTYLAAWNRIPPQRPAFFFSFLSKICRYISMDRLDWNNAAKRKAEVVSLSAELEQCIPDNAMERQLEARELGRVLSEFLRHQSRDSRVIFLRRYYYMDSVEEIARRYGFTESKVKTRLCRTREKLRIYLRQEGMTE